MFIPSLAWMFNNNYNNKLKLQSKKNSPNSFRRKLDFVMGLVMEEEVRLRLRLRQTHGVVRLRVTASKSGRVWGRFARVGPIQEKYHHVGVELVFSCPVESGTLRKHARNQVCLMFCHLASL